MKYTAIALVTVLALTGCGEIEDAPVAQQEPGQTADPSEQASIAEEAAETEAPEDVDELTEDDGPSEGQHRIEFDSPYTYESNGVKLVVDAIQFNDVENLEADVTEFLEDDTQTVLVARMQASNDTGKTINFYPNQATLKIGREQVDADMIFSDSFAGMDWLDQTDDEGQVYWQLKTPFEEAIAAGSLILTTSAPHDSESWDDVGEPVNMTIEWSAS